MRPHSIVMFERLILGSLAVSALSFILSYDEVTYLLASDPAMQELGLGSGFLLGVVAAGYAIFLLLWVLIAHKASNVAKWILIVLAALGLISLPGLLSEPWNTTALLGLASYGLEFAAIIYLFRDDARAWFKGEWHGDATTFD